MNNHMTFPSLDAPSLCTRHWLVEAIECLEAEASRSADTHLLRLDLPRCNGITLYLKDESSHSTGSLKHRLARSLFLYALCNGKVGPQTTIIEASSGSTAVSEAYFAKLLGLRFITVVPRTTSVEKIAAIEFYGGEVHFIDDPKSVYKTAQDLADRLNGYYIDQFTYAERATDWRGNNNIANSIFSQLSREKNPIPDWIVASAGTGGTSATLGRYIRYGCYSTRLCVADPEGSVFHKHYMDRTIREIDGCNSVIEGIGRARVEPSFLPDVIDRMFAVPDEASLAAMRVISKLIGRSCGGSTGTNLWAVGKIVSDMIKNNQTGSIVTLICDSGERYRSTYLDDNWLAKKNLDIAPYVAALEALFINGRAFTK
ncbi:PLP-dependent cysteine synthase family protein [Bartonella sp. HY406]|uniref:PLP-dependent cysteine synthase family protein n=1 Tax=Bartonella sp. HY406 TaxID=2979331 RepID=UPI0021C96FC2|nr:PLP-dependent cysteine synthase family protein [Bartonella sp. HY406]UXN02644.1 PLP-dependent cysteine synthase family protein [Bartonella sp. HY406]